MLIWLLLNFIVGSVDAHLGIHNIATLFQSTIIVCLPVSIMLVVGCDSVVAIIATFFEHVGPFEDHNSP